MTRDPFFFNDDWRNNLFTYLFVYPVAFVMGIVILIVYFLGLPIYFLKKKFG